MTAAHRRTTPLYRSGIDRIKAAGFEPEADDYAEVWEAARRCIEGDGGAPALLEVPVVVGSVTLYPRRIGAALWWERYGKKWYGGSPEDEVLALAWMLAHGQDVALFRTLTTKWKCDARLIAWQMGLAASVTLPDLAWGIHRLFAQTATVGNKPDGEQFDAASEVDWGRAIARLCATYHQKPDYFLWEIGERAAVELLTNAL